MIVCCGEALIDMLPRQLPDGRPAFSPVPGGAVFNTAVALGRLGEDAGFFGGISTDGFGGQLGGYLADSNVSRDYCVHADRPTTLAFVELVDGQARYSFFDENSAGRMLGVTDLPAFSDEVRVLHFGALSLISEPCGSAFEELARRHHQQMVISLDPNIRTTFIQNKKIYKKRLARLIKMSDVVKVSEEDLAWYAPGKEFLDIADEWISSGVAVVILTTGGAGARAVTETLQVSVPAKKVRVVDTVGAGDAFNAGFLSCLNSSGMLSKETLGTIDKDKLTAALEFASHVAAYVVGQTGANPPWANGLNDKVHALCGR